jgi:ankyrin repeat protein
MASRGYSSLRLSVVVWHFIACKADTISHVRTCSVIVQVDTTDCDADTALHAAASALHVEVVKRLTKAVPPGDMARLLQRKNCRGRSPLHCAFDSYSSGAVAGTERWRAAESCASIVKHLVALHKEHNVSVDMQDAIEEASTLYLAARYNVVEAVKVLLECGADPNIGTNLSDTPLMAAAAASSSEVMKILLAAGADPCAVLARTRETALHIVLNGAVTDEDAHAMAMALLDAGADVNAVDIEEKSPVSWAAELRKEKLVRCFDKSYSDVVANSGCAIMILKQESCTAVASLSRSGRDH